MNLLLNVKNGQNFCLEDVPTDIFERICDKTKYYPNVDDFGRDCGAAYIVVQVKSLKTGKLKDIRYPSTIKVIPLGK